MTRDPKWSVPKTSTITDPRIAIARHIGWIRPLTPITDFTLPEPDNYNYAGFGAKPYECPFIQDQVFYRDRKLNGWWTVYYVPAEQEQEFLDWVRPVKFDRCWAPSRSSKLRHPRTLLWNKAAAAELSTNERLFTMGYYDELQSAYNIDIGHALGSPRLNMPQDEFT